MKMEQNEDIFKKIMDYEKFRDMLKDILIRSVYKRLQKWGIERKMYMKYFFDIPVYRLQKDRYYEEMSVYIEKSMYPGPPSHNDELKQFYEKYPERKLIREEQSRNSYGGAWNYNEIIGWIQLHFLGSQIRGEFWGVKAQRLVRSRRKVFEYHDWNFAKEIYVPPEADNEEIFRLINKYLSDCKKELKGRYLDTSRLDIIGPYVDWRSLWAE